VDKNVVVVGDKLFGGKAWTISRHTRANGSGFWQLTEMAGFRTDWPSYSNGHVTYDRPEALPQAVKSWVEKVLRKVAGGR
jgi:hypothetical protein